MELIEGIPAGLAACVIGGEEQGVAGLSDEMIRVRAAGPLSSIDGLRLYLLDFERAAYREIAPESARVVSIAPWGPGWLCDIAIEDARWRRESRRALGEWARYIRLKAADDDGALAAALAGCPDEPVTARTLEGQKARWFAGLAGFDAPGSWTLALSLDEPHKCAAFAREGAAAYQAALLAQNGLSAHPLLQRAAGRVYVGSQHGPCLVPEGDLLAATLRRAAGEGLPVTLALPPVRQARFDWALALIRQAAGLGADELVANDFGLMAAARQEGLQPLLGIHLNRRRKDPRIAWKKGYPGREALLAENSLNDAAFRAWLAARGVARYEYESCEGPVAVAPGRHSLHLPFYQTNTATGCVLAARCEGRDPGKPRPDADCPMWCRERALIYPDWMNIVGRYNSLFGLNQSVLREAEALAAWLNQGIDRLVLELL